MAKAVICDRCGKLITEVYYTVSITAHDVDTSTLPHSEALSHNLKRNFDLCFNGNETYCTECKNSIQNIVNEKKVAK